MSAVQQSGHEILSQPIMVEVYAPPVIYPQEIFLVPGASYVVCFRYESDLVTLPFLAFFLNNELV